MGADTANTIIVDDLVLGIDQKTMTVSLSGNSTGTEFFFEADQGLFTGGGCAGKRSGIQGGTLTVPAHVMSVTIKVASAHVLESRLFLVKCTLPRKMLT